MESSPVLCKENGRITFRVAIDKTPEPIAKTFNQVTFTKALETLEAWNGEVGSGGSILAHSGLPETVHVAGWHNGFVGGAFSSYSEHSKFCFRPDDVYSQIMLGFARYVDANAEALRSKFVGHAGKKELEVVATGSIRDPNVVSHCVHLMQNLIAENIKDASVRDWVIPNFSTTTATDKVVFGALLMGAVQKYFDFKVTLACGHPEITLLGNVEDWMDLARRVERLAEFDLEGGAMIKWVNLLRPICQKFIETASGKPDVTWWSRICHEMANGSGPRYISGWLSVFQCIDAKGRWQGDNFSCRTRTLLETSEWPIIDTKSVSNGVVFVKIGINENGNAFPAHLIAGSFAVEQFDRDPTCARPRLDWVLVRDSKAPQKSPQTSPQKLHKNWGPIWEFVQYAVLIYMTYKLYQVFVDV